jgi:hypothetical protein
MAGIERLVGERDSADALGQQRPQDGKRITESYGGQRNAKQPQQHQTENILRATNHRLNRTTTATTLTPKTTENQGLHAH